MPAENIRLSEISDLAYKWLKDSGQQVAEKFIKSEIISHPDYPALTSLTDLLDAGDFEYAAVRATPEDMSSVNFPCVVNLNLSSESSGLYQVNSKLEFESVKKYWNGIVLYAHPESKWQHPINNEILIRNKKGLTYFIVLGISLFILSLIGGFFSGNGLKSIFWLLSSASGILLSSLLLSQELGLATEIIQKVCGIGGEKAGCSTILNSKYAKGKLGVSISVLAFSYFVAQWLFFLGGAFNLGLGIYVGSIIKFANVGILIACWSIYTQKYVVKNWCTLCIGIAIILMSQFSFSIIEKLKFNLIGLFLFGLVFIVVMMITQGLKKIFEKLNVSEYKARELNKWKKDTYLFLNQWKETALVDCSPLKNELELSNKDGALKITIACSPYCNPCAKAHDQIHDLIRLYGDYMSVQVRFGVNANDYSNKITKAVNHIFNAVEINTDVKTVTHNWFEHMSMDTFSSLYPLKCEKLNHEILNDQMEWSKNAHISYTPTVFLNGRILPKRYSIEDLTSMIPELYDQVDLMANQELFRIRKRTKDGIRQAQLSGRHVNHAPFGYRNAKDENDKGILVVEEKNAEIVQSIFKNYLEGMPVFEIHKKAKALGFHNAGNSAIPRILSNVIYVGMVKVLGTRNIPEKQVRGIHQPIIGETDFWRVQELLGIKRKSKSQPKEEFPLRGILKCWCGKSMTAGFSKGKNKYYLYYRCTEHVETNFRGDKLHEQFEDLLELISFNKAQVAKITKEANDFMSKSLVDNKALLAAREKQIAELDRKIEKLEDRLMNDEIDGPTFKKLNIKLHAEKGVLVESQMELKKDKPSTKWDKFNRLMPHMTSLKGVYKIATLEGKQSLIKGVFKHKLTYSDGAFRTLLLDSVFSPNTLKAKEKGLLFEEQPLPVWDKIPLGSPYGNRTCFASRHHSGFQFFQKGSATNDAIFLISAIVDS